VLTAVTFSFFARLHLGGVFLAFWNRWWSGEGGGGVVQISRNQLEPWSSTLSREYSCSLNDSGLNELILWKGRGCFNGIWARVNRVPFPRNPVLKL
jgi:hypothetical protein